MTLESDIRLEQPQREWDDLAQVDPLWAILADPSRKGGRWTLGEFFETGERDVEQVLSIARDLGAPRNYDRSLDFGCGVGRLTRALSSAFAECYGVDISPQMVEQARELNGDRPNCHFVVNDTKDLARFESNLFDLVISLLVLQHMKTTEIALGYLREFLRVARPGGLVVCQIPVFVPARLRMRPNVRLYGVLRKLGFPPGFLHRLGPLHPMTLIAVPEADVRDVVRQDGGTVARTDEEELAPGVRGLRYWIRLT